MSQELVGGLLAAVCGLLGTILGAVVAARATKAGAVKNADAVLTQGEEQTNAEHAHWLREQRLKAYDGFLESWDEFMRTMRGEQGTREFALTSVAGRTAERAGRIALLGPPEVTQAAEELANAAWQDVAAMTELVQSSRSFRESDNEEFQELQHSLDEMLEGSEELRELISSRNQGDSLDDHPLIIDFVSQAQNFMSTLPDQMRRIEERSDQMRAIGKKASAVAELIKKNKQVRDHSRERFVAEARRALASPPHPHKRNVQGYDRCAS